MSLAEAMDNFVKRTGLYRITMIERPRPRALRWLPLLVIGVLIAGYALEVRATNSGSLRGSLTMILAGAALFLGGYTASFFLRFFGPRLVTDPLQPLDERELIVRARAVAISGNIISFAAMIACFYGAFAVPFGWWMPRAPHEWGLLGLVIQGIWLVLPVLVASWLQPRPVAED